MTSGAKIMSQATGGASGSRGAILDAIRRSHGRGVLPEDQQAALRDAMARAGAKLVPARGQGSPSQVVDLFVTMAEAVAATVDRVDDWQAVPAALADMLKSRNLPTDMAVAPDARLDGVAAHPLFTARRGPALPQDVVGVSVAFAGVAETGSLVLVSGPETPTSLNFLPDVHVVVIEATTISGPFEPVWTGLRERFGDALPRTVNLITGPSRTGDIEQTIQLGAHGPRQLHIIVVGHAA